jgi:hypothetical protein
MKVVLKNRKTSEYFKSPGVWTEKAADAFAFPDSATAMNFYMRHYLPDVDVVSLSGDSEEQVSLHLRPDQLPRGESLKDGV